MGAGAIVLSRRAVAPDVCVTLARYAPGLAQPRHAHAETSVTLVLAGSVDETVGARSEAGQALSVVVKPGGVEHADRYGASGARMLQVQLGPRFLAGLGSAAPPRWRWLHGGRVASAGLRLLELTRRDGPADHDDALADAVDALVASLQPERGPARAGAAPRWILDARAEIDDAGPRGVRVRDIAARAGVHPVYLARQFRRFFGCSITEHVRQRRVHAAARMLGAPAPLAQVSAACGFTDQSHLCRVFKAATGLTPHAFRRASGSS